MIGQVALPNAINPMQVQMKFRQIRQASVENISKMLRVPRPHLNRPLPGTGNRGAINLYV